MINFFTHKKAKNTPSFTIRMGVTSLKSHEKTNKNLELKSFLHFTLGCTTEDESEEIKKTIQLLINSLEYEISFRASEVINCGNNEHLLWAIKLNLGLQEKELRELFGKLFDKMMCPENDGNLYVWDVNNVQTKAISKSPHITIGSKEEDLETAKNLIKLKYEFTFGVVQYKKIGQYEPHISLYLKENTVRDSLIFN